MMEHIDTLLFHIREAQKALEDDYPRYKDYGKEHSVLKAVQSLRRAHQVATVINATPCGRSSAQGMVEADGGK
jgi:hypothetical protein